MTTTRRRRADSNRCSIAYSSRQRLCEWCETDDATVYRDYWRLWVCDTCDGSNQAQRDSDKLEKPRPLIRNEPRQGYIYFIQAGEDGPVKIGWAVNPMGRLAQFRAAHWVKLELVDYFPGTVRDERALHRHYAQYRIHNEWFQPIVLELAGVRRAETA